MGTVTIHKRYFTLDDVSDGDINTEYEAPEIIECEDTDDAIGALTERGLCGEYAFSVHPVRLDSLGGHEWFSLPDGSVTADEYDANYTGRRMEMSGHLHDWSDDDFRAIVAAVTS